MKNDTITTCLHGEMIEMRLPEWIVRAQAICNGGQIPWHAALTEAMKCLPFSECISPDDPNAVQVLTWVIPEAGGHYTEFCSAHHILDAMWVPKKAEWLPFRTKYVLPFLQAHAAMATAHSLQRLLQHVAPTPTPTTLAQIPRHAVHAPLPAALLQAAQWGAGR
jgi:hypothetical protein